MERGVVLSTFTSIQLVYLKYVMFIFGIAPTLCNIYLGRPDTLM